MLKSYSSISFFVILGFFIAGIHGFVLGQETKVSGRVTDGLTNEAIPFATVSFKGTVIGAVTDFNGYFVIQTDKPTDSLTASYVGYNPITLKIIKGKTQTANFLLKVNKVDLKEVVIKAGENPANILLRKVIDNKEKNDKKKLDWYQFEAYNKMEFDLTDIPQDFKDKKLIKPFAFIFDNIDSSVTNSKPFLPFFITETLSDIYFRSDPKTTRESIKASKISGLENESVTQFLGDMYQNIDIYENYIDVFGKSFVSPISNVGTVYYKYYLTDSAFLDNQWCYKLKFKPRRKQELTFVGDCWVHDTTFAIKKIDMRVVEDANINFVEDLAVVKEYSRIENKQWMLSKELLVVDFAARKDGVGFIGRKSASYKDFKLNEPINDTIFSGSTDIKVQENSVSRDETFWVEARHDSLSDREKLIYHMVDTIKTLPAFKTYVDIITLFFTGHYEIGKIELGPYFTFYSFNPVEGNRFRMGGRTSPKFSDRLRLEGYVAYGTRDQEFKYMGGFRYFLNTKPREAIGVRYKNDVAQFGQSENAFQDDNILSSLFRRNPPDKLTQLEGYRVYYEKEWLSGYSHRISLDHGVLVPLGKLSYDYYTNEERTEFRSFLNTSELSLKMRFAFREKFVEGKTGRISLGSDFPVTQLIYTVGLEDVLGSDFSYQKIILKVDDIAKLPPFGYTYYAVEAGKTFGIIPSPLLNVHQGNESYFYDYASFNLMNYYEFVSDQYASLFLVHHFEGFFLDKVPLLRKLKWREVASLRAVYGSLKEENRNLMVDPTAIGSLSAKPYAEVGFGVENIFKILRFDFMYRLSYLDNPDIAKFGIRGSFQITF
ncbi:MAG: carboxypeptidase-like regulatory domain-containing protein [Bacteroidetes bacterium]|nr:carboxypeptidase-like regulatory domain-containing protein [Bacteroidota bacterium]